jgi:16S rRNA (cytosine1402-N4)-methyltransferase
LGAAGHYSAVASRLSPGGVAIGIDRDAQAIRRAKSLQAKGELAPAGVTVVLEHGSFGELERVVRRSGHHEVDRVLLDLGFSSDQLDDPERGFSIQRDGPLDMRMDQQQELTARVVVNDYSADQLLRVLRDYGEERQARRIVEALVKARRRKAIETTGELAAIIAEAMGGRRGRIHPATRSFQGIRIEVNDEAEQARQGVSQAARLLKTGGRLAVITFHGLEERWVKDGLKPSMRSAGRADWFMKRCGGVLKPSSEEMRLNPRSRSAKLRVYEKQGSKA